MTHLKLENEHKQMEQTNLDLTLARHPLYDEVEPEEINEIDGQLEKLLKNCVAGYILAFLNSIRADYFFIKNQT